MQSEEVFIGVPCFNSASTLSKTLESLLQQDFTNFKVLISDDCSSDNSYAKGREYCLKDSRFSIVKQKQNLGLYANLKYLFDESNSPYFMWLASDDYLSQDFLSKNYHFLSQNLNYVASAGKPYYLFPEETLEGPILELSGSIDERLTNFLARAMWSHPIFYSLMRRQVISDFPYLGERFAAADWSLDLHLLSKGPINTLNSGGIYFGTSGVSRRKNANRYFSQSLLDKLFPLLRFSRYTIYKFLFVTDSFFLWRFLISLNFTELKKDLVFFKINLQSVIQRKMRSQ